MNDEPINHEPKDKQTNLPTQQAKTLR